MDSRVVHVDEQVIRAADWSARKDTRVTSENEAHGKIMLHLANDSPVTHTDWSTSQAPVQKHPNTTKYINKYIFGHLQLEVALLEWFLSENQFYVL